ncbi:DUF6089 family protein [Dysgonomonas sp. BGC7]|uniref:type IX secretion system protein PorG n=1 Tax=Dysgonomonas sp. BGC7 TaxID=1658008 RepID=UPI000682D798|nr:DUF6089 family protein [Dysgonomonas sp. BGC7]MBD8387215.1 hypothetical protein [Dysgonomonas sp. BGC7]
MNKKIYLTTILSILYSLFLSNQIMAQDDYKYEIGGMAGTSFYMGDANKSKLYQHPGLSAGIVFRYNKDLRWSIKSNLVIGKVSGDTRDSGNKFPLGQQTSFSRMFYELGSQIEFNFFNYSDKFAYLGTKRISPYVFTGLGITFGSGDKKYLDANIPIGIGVKYKIRDRLNLGFEFSFRKLFSDSFDVTERTDFDLEEPYKIKGNILKNNDWYSLTMISVTWNFGARVCPCLNID